MTLVKICGIKHEQHALEAARAGANLIGFVFVPVRREVMPDVAREIVSTVRSSCEQPPAAIGLFVNETADVINATVELVGLNFVQLHGDESPDLASQIDVPVIKAIRMKSVMQPDDLRATIETHLEYCDGVLIDSHVPGHWGGTGVVGDWTVVSQLARDYPIVLAGGLTPENVAEAIQTVRPAVVDVSSGVETDGEKDSTKVRSFIERAHSSAHGIDVQWPATSLTNLITDNRAGSESGLSIQTRSRAN
jgi:phosphoribosylanthranilate isomerase